ncbi:TAXI family TRAP transporter solute-binding subunit [Desulfonema magnum]|uniref:TRAP transporter, receptor protein n=1 Tax=Desulfonema magnum TaxID=45655 RepID=A0A975GTP9_9BACT|nr:TAXI family TRAP transporter solute-binding subunit [Desulfonema magnum]QTA93329.1 TRAP transporter, receptor protein [Desulfonema magnum]
MKKFVFIISALAMYCFVSFSAFGAEKKILKIGTGSKQGVYSTIAAPIIKKNLAGTNLTLEIVPGGSKINLDKLKKKEIELAIVQFDALLQANADIATIGFLHDEYAHLVVSKKSKINEFSDLNKSHTVAVGPLNAGSRITWNNFISLDKKYKDVATLPLRNTRAITALESGEADAYFCVTGLRDKYLMEASKKKAFTLVEIDAWAFNNLKYKKRKVYEFFKIDDDVYPGLMPSKLTTAVKSIKLSAVVVCLGEWADEHEEEFETLAAAVSNALPLIKQKTEND